MQGKRLLILICFTIAFTWLASLIEYSINYHFSFYELGRSLFELAIIEIIIIYRICIVRYYEKLALAESQKQTEK